MRKRTFQSTLFQLTQPILRHVNYQRVLKVKVFWESEAELPVKIQANDNFILRPWLHPKMMSTEMNKIQTTKKLLFLVLKVQSRKRSLIR
jgi:hypothetical protein